MNLPRHFILFLVLCATPVFLFPAIEEETDLDEFDGQVISQEEDFFDEEEHQRITRQVKEEEEEKEGIEEDQLAPDDRQSGGPKRQRPVNRKPGNKRGNANRLGQKKKPNTRRPRPGNQKKGQQKGQKKGQKKGKPNGQRKNQLKFRPRSPLTDQMNKMFDEVLKSFGQSLASEVPPIDVKVSKIPRQLKVQSWAYVKSNSKKPRTEVAKPENIQETVAEVVQQTGSFQEEKKDLVPESVNSRVKRDEQDSSSDVNAKGEEQEEENLSPQEDGQKAADIEQEADESDNQQDQVDEGEIQSENESNVQANDNQAEDEEDTAESQPSLTVVPVPSSEDESENDEDEMEFSNSPEPVIRSDGTVEYILKLVDNFVAEDDQEDSSAEDSVKQEDDQDSVKQEDDQDSAKQEDNEDSLNEEKMDATPRQPGDDIHQDAADDCHGTKQNQRGLHRNPKTADNQEASDPVPKEPEDEAGKEKADVQVGDQTTKKKSNRRVPQQPNAFIIGFDNLKRKGDILIADRDANTRVLKVPVAIGPLHLHLKSSAAPELQNTRVKTSRLSADFFLTEREGNVVGATFRRIPMAPRTSLVTLQRKDSSTPPQRRQSARLVTHLSREMARMWNSGSVLQTVGGHFRKIYVKNITPGSKELPELKSLSEK